MDYFIVLTLSDNMAKIVDIKARKRTYWVDIDVLINEKVVPYCDDLVYDYTLYYPYNGESYDYDTIAREGIAIPIASFPYGLTLREIINEKYPEYLV